MAEHVRFVPRRELGRTGFMATALGIGDLADRTIPIETCVATARRALDAGLNVIDTAPSYEDGYSEEIVGRAVREVPRDSVFVIDKIDHPDQPVRLQIDASLKRLQLPYVDLFVFHNVSSLEVFERLCAPGGGFDQVDRAAQRGKCRFRGISSHHPDVLRRALILALCDAVMFPLGPFVDRRYVDEILPLARERRAVSVCF
ncbi:MAG TPA: aldo/keto reductase, partial [Gemmata sp.]|nr:aldo/keto reductase [Gemmata sp.]